MFLGGVRCGCIFNSEKRNESLLVARNPGFVPLIHAEQIRRFQHLRVCGFASLGEVTSLRASFGECGTSPPSPRDFGYLCSFFPSRVCPLHGVVGKGAGKGLRRLNRGERDLFGAGTTGNEREARTLVDETFVRIASGSKNALFFVSVRLGVQMLCDCCISILLYYFSINDASGL